MGLTAWGADGGCLWLRRPSGWGRTTEIRTLGLRVKMCVWLGVSLGLDLAFLDAD